MHILQRFRIGLLNVEKFFMVGLLALMLFVVLLQIFFRSVLSFSLSWGEEICNYIFIWLILIGSVYGFDKGLHFSVDFLVNKIFSNFGRRVISLIDNILITIFIIFYFYAGVYYCKSMSIEKTPALEIPIIIVLSVFPITGLLMLVHLGLREVLKNYDLKKGE